MSATPPVSALPERRAPASRASAIEVARGQLDEALLALRDVVDPAVPVRRAEERLAQALRGCYLALARRTDHHAYHAALDESVAATRGALGALQESPTLHPSTERVLGLVAGALGGLLSAGTLPTSGPADLPDADPAAGPVFTPATIGAPALIAAPRRVLLPAVPLREPPPAPPPADAEAPPPPPIADLGALEALRAEAEARLAAFDAPPPEPEPAGDESGAQRAPAPVLPVEEADARAAAEQLGPPPLAEDALVFDRARSCLEDLAALGNMRRPLPGEPWASPRTEERLLARVDAIVACGPEVLPALVKLIEDRPVPDPDLTWAFVFLFGSLAGDDAADQVARLVLSAELEAPDMVLFVADALALAPSPALERPLRAWLEVGRPAPLRAAAVTALGRRRQLGWAELAAAAGDADGRVALAAARALGFAASLADPLVADRLLRHADDAVTRAAMASALALRSGLGLERARALTAEGQGARADAALLLAVSGGPEAWEVLARAGHAPAVLEAMGWFGDLRAIDLLIAALDGDDPTAAGAAVGALYRVTGAALTDDEPDPEYPDGAGAFARAFVTPQRPGELTTKPEHWRAWWRRHRGEADQAVRYRFGHPWSPADDLWELEDALSGATERQLAYLEIVARTGVRARVNESLDLEDFVVRQRQQLAELRANVERVGTRPGEWPMRLA